MTDTQESKDAEAKGSGKAEAASNSAKPAEGETKRGYWSDEAQKATKDGTITLSSGDTLAYQVVADEIRHYDKDGNVDGKFFHVAYFKKGVPAADRPITFAFNGGPGSSAMWLHLGLMGPKRIHNCDVDDDWQGMFDLSDNPHTTLAHSDLVFIDPMGTGFSRGPTESKERAFFDSKKDIESIAGFIEHFLIQHKRWQSEVVLCGESYGGYRGVGVCSYLQESLGIFPKAVLFVAPAIDFNGLAHFDSNIMAHALHLPTYAATAFYHGKLDASMGATAKEVHDKAWAFAQRAYIPALVQGYDFNDREALAAELSRLTGISADEWLHHNLKLNLKTFTSLLCKSSKKYIGRLDSRYLGDLDYWALMSEGYLDPSATELTKRFVPAINSYLREELGVSIDYRYESLSYDVISNWKFHQANAAPNMNDHLVRAMQLNGDLKVYVCSGLYDLAVPPETIEFAFKQLNLTQQAIKRVHFTQLAAGHMSYINEDCVTQMAEFFHQAFALQSSDG